MTGKHEQVIGQPVQIDLNGRQLVTIASVGLFNKFRQAAFATSADRTRHMRPGCHRLSTWQDKLLEYRQGVGQGIDFREGEKAGMAWTRARALAAGNMEAVDAVDGLAPYPNGDFTIAKADGWRKYAIPYGSLIYNKPDLRYYFQTPRLSPEYSEADRQAWSKGSEFSVTTLWPRLADVSFKPVKKMGVPLVFLLGRHDYTVPSPVAADWFARVKAPSKKLVWLEHSAHMPMVEEPGHFFAALLQDVLPLTKDGK